MICDIFTPLKSMKSVLIFFDKYVCLLVKILVIIVFRIKTIFILYLIEH